MLMKKISLLLVGVLALFSCEQEELDNFVESSGVGQVMTRAIGSSADFDPISELAEIPVNILNIGNSKQKYLTCKEKGTEICLTDKDDGSLRQRWYLKYGSITNLLLLKTNTSFKLKRIRKRLYSCSFSY